MNKTTLFTNYDNVDHNIKILAKGSDVCLVVKAGMYGSGYVNLPELINRGYDFFGVSTIEEAYILREVSKDIRILIFAPIANEELPEALSLDLQITVVDIEQLKLCDKDLKIHLKFDTAMGRIGFSENEVDDIIKLLKESQRNITGLFTHMPCADREDITLPQIEKFRRIVSSFDSFDIKYIHMQNSLGCMKYDIDFVNLKRPGIGIWGYLTTREENEEYGQELRPSLSLYAKVLQNKYYKGYIGYDHQEYVDGMIATLRIGYHDGINRRFTGYKFKDGSKIVGKICMCQMMLLVDKPIEYKEIFGPSENIYDFVQYSGIIVHELIATLAQRIDKKNVKIGEFNE